jgi:hypothetical protein
VPVTTAAPVMSGPSASAVHASAIDVLANAIYSLQRQVHQIASCLPAQGGYGGFGPYAGAGLSASFPIYGMPGYSALSSASSTAAIIVHTAPASQGVPITHIQFPPSSSPIPGYSEPSPVVTTPSEIILYYRLNHSIWSLSDNKESSR